MTALFTLLPEAVAIVPAGSKPEILELLAGTFAKVYGLDHEDVRGGLRDREDLGSTGFGRGVAIPHARLGSVGRPLAAFLKLQSPVDFDAADGMPVDLVFGLLSPEAAGSTHLHALAAISRMMRDEHMHQMLTQATEPEALFGVLCNVIDRDAA
ncbi:PTS IIA-like nitrogen-regulatory protein PtsN [Novosphingobium marinum]|uniref:PTS system nitrogen regulatory IIA component n=1 Tax=Novosphingobium marinum TaxID=1514948 RepID=A0A7Y9XW97_9SPHN|nr:PTS sugar transporter subunit IIA [Novosphingobium marinum]NYH95635.1 PTS system nitrogen regulatory IIA component [Novosphingobium marinum]GGC28608.1 PTS IIA-like nitrogen-regulatory protein PtsN [Novosphingobium marinum]